MKKAFFVFFLTSLLGLFFFFLGATSSLAAISEPYICESSFRDSSGQLFSADDWCTDCPDGPYDFCKTDSHFHFGCKSEGLFGMFCSCDEDNAWYEYCPGGCTNWDCNQGQTSPPCSGGSCNLGPTCTPNGCNGQCPNGCTVDQDPDCGCKSGNNCCGKGCTYLNDSDCSSQKEITISSPRGGETFYTQTEIRVIWDSTGFGAMGNLCIDLLNENGSVAKDINCSLPLGGTFTWLIPNDVTTGRYKIRICEKPANPFSQCGETTAETPLFTITQYIEKRIWNVRTDRNSYNAGQDAYVFWESSGIDLNDFCIYLYKGSQNKGNYCTGQGVTVVRSPFEWTLDGSLETGSDYRFRVCEHGMIGCQDLNNPDITVWSNYFTVTKVEQKTITNVTTNKTDYDRGEMAIVNWQYTGIQANDFCIYLYEGTSSKGHYCTGEGTTEVKAPFAWILSTSLAEGPTHLYHFTICEHNNPPLVGCTDIKANSPNFTIRAGGGEDNCGNGQLDPGEEDCDNSATPSFFYYMDTCEEAGKGTGALGCKSNCTLDYSGCSASLCHNGRIDAGEDCDFLGTNEPLFPLEKDTCYEVNPQFLGGILLCSNDCHFDTSQCSTTPPPNTCSAMGGEWCQQGQVCESTSDDFTSQANDAPDHPSQRCCRVGTCRTGGQNCSWQNDSCGQTPCATTEMHQTCGPAGCTGGSCTAGQTQCVSDASCGGGNGGENCGDGTIDAGEQCDGSNLGGATCESLGYGTGALGCKQNCTFDYSGCSGGGGIIEIENPLLAGEFEDIIENIIDFIFKLALVLTPLMIIIGGILFVTAGGNLTQIAQARRLMVWTAIGFGIVLLSKGIIVIINQLLGVK